MKHWGTIADRLHAEGWSYGIAEHFTKHGFLYWAYLAVLVQSEPMTAFFCNREM